MKHLNAKQTVETPQQHEGLFFFLRKVLFFFLQDLICLLDSLISCKQFNINCGGECNTHNPNHAGMSRTSDRVKPIPNPCHDWQGLSDSFTLLSSASLSDSFTKLLSRNHSLNQFIIFKSTLKSTANVSFRF